MGLAGLISLFILPCLHLALHFSVASAKRSTYIVHMDKSMMPKVFASSHHWYSSTIDSIKIEGPSSQSESHHFEPKLVYTYENALHGFSAVMSKDELESLKKFPGFISAYRDTTLTLETTRSPEFLSLSSATGLWPASEYGANAIIGVIDTGIWPESPSFKDDGMSEVPKRWKGICQEGQEFNSSLCNRKLIGARYYNKGFQADDPTSDLGINSARDNDGHGTHVASIAAGNYVEGASYFGYAVGTARGIAPRARLAIYKVFWQGGMFASDVIAGIDQAVSDGVDVISISLSTRNMGFYEDPIAIASFSAMEKGILVSCAAGNQGPNRGSVRNAMPWAMSVASGSVDRWFAGTLTLGNGVKFTGWTMFPAKALIRNLPLIYNETISDCTSDALLSEVSDGRAIIICRFEEDAFNTQRRVVSRSRVPAAIFISDDQGIYDDHNFPHPGVVITPKEGETVIDYAKRAVNPEASITFQQTLIGTKPAPAVSLTSSRGPARSYSGILKPDIMAPGILILAAYSPIASSAEISTNIRLSSDFNLISGTSMACPHASGIAAMLKAAHPEWSPSAIRSAIITTARTLDNTKTPIKDINFDYEEASPLATGAGHVDPNQALDPGLIYDATPEDYVNFLCSLNFTQEQFLTIARSASYNCSNASSDLNYPSFMALYEIGGGKVRLIQNFKRTLTNVGNEVAKYKAKLVVPKGATVTVSPQNLVFRKKHEKQSYTLTIRYRGSEEQEVTYGSISWVEENGKHIVKSPIVVAPRYTHDM